MFLLLIAGIFCLLGFITCWLILRSQKNAALDKIASDFLIKHRKPWLNKVMLFFTHLGLPVGVLIVFLPQLIFPKTRMQMALPAIIATAIAWWLAFFLKRLIKRPRPMGDRLVEESDHSFPSFHATSSASMYVSFAVTGSQLFPDLLWFWCTVPILTFLLIGVSRVYLGVHYLSDIMAGWFFGSGVALITMYLMTK